MNKLITELQNTNKDLTKKINDYKKIIEENQKKLNKKNDTNK
jgi:hypothetical protein